MSALLLLVQSRLYWPPSASAGPGRIGPDVQAQLRYLRGALRQGAGEEMQGLFPEGFFFSHVLYGLAWLDLAATLESSDPLRSEALAEATWAAEHLDSPAGRAPFSPQLDPPLGVFAVGWATWLRAGLFALQTPAQRPAQATRLNADCAALGAAFARSATPFLSAYPGQSWPVDSVVAVAALRRCDALFGPQHSATIARWLAQAQARLDPATGLLAHRTDPRDGQLLEGARGSSQSVIARFLPAIDPALGLAHYERFRAQFVTTVAGIPGVREYPHGRDGVNDIDSGPLLAGVSLSASAVTLGAARAWGDSALAEPLRHSGEWLGMALEWGGEKRYAFGLLPVGDAFLVWSKTAPLWPTRPADGAFSTIVPWWWRLPAHALGLALLALIWLPLRGMRFCFARTLTLSLA